ncbi:F-box/LRR-repeat protein [Trifolium medium]|uniref:F-box/LRR-repeat protein n=1 Tax=Trifolium medium TaxID=97028 RepID=A0A392MU66_9FABA|nr:F-box/LRR-repeat protein [Trifolium medium]
MEEKRLNKNGREGPWKGEAEQEGWIQEDTGSEPVTLDSIDSFVTDVDGDLSSIVDELVKLLNDDWEKMEDNNCTDLIVYDSRNLTNLALFALVGNCSSLSEIRMEYTTIGKETVENSNSLIDGYFCSSSFEVVVMEEDMLCSVQLFPSRSMVFLLSKPGSRVWC